jgi:hypothetical protein
LAGSVAKITSEFISKEGAYFCNNKKVEGEVFEDEVSDEVIASKLILLRLSLQKVKSVPPSFYSVLITTKLIPSKSC